MLVLTRKPQETIVLSSGTVFKVLGIERGRVRVGIAAPEGVRILRGECAAGQLERARQMAAEPANLADTPNNTSVSGDAA